MSIRPLPEKAIQQIKSSVTITSLNDVVVGLVKNSLDAAATSINISVDYSRGNCSVEDDGEGIEEREFAEGGGLGKHHHTSRYPPSDHLHGSHGDFVAALATFSLLSITSQHRSLAKTNTISIRNSTILSRNLPSPEHQGITVKHGTRVVVHDLFGSMAVRVKQRPLVDDKAVAEKSWHRLVRAISGLILAWPMDVSVSLREGHGRTAIRFRPPRPAEAVPKLSSKVARVLVQSGLADDISYGTWVSVGGSRSQIAVSGCVSLNAVASRRVQFLSLGIHPFGNDSGRNALFDEINRVFANSDFATSESTDDDDIQETSFGRGSKTRKPLERWPMFFFRIDRTGDGSLHSSSAEDVLDQPRTLSIILDLLSSICLEFLKKHHFQPRAGHLSVNSPHMGNITCRNSASASPRTRPRSSTPKAARPDSPFDLWRTVKVGRPAQPVSKLVHRSEEVQTVPVGSPPVDEQRRPLIDRSGKLLRRPFENIKWPPKRKRNEMEDMAEENHPPSPPARGRSATPPKPPSNEGQIRYLQPGEVPAVTEPSDWLKGILETWKNPVFEATEARIPSIEGATAMPGFGASCAADDCEFDLSKVRHRVRLSKSALAHAEVISQVDRKFILIKTLEVSAEEATKSVLVLVDQHAADERCHLEGLMQDYFETDEGSGLLRARTESLARPVRFEFSVKDCELLGRFSAHFEHWGVFYRLSPTQDGSSAGPSNVGVIDVVSLPPSILERARTEPKLLADLLRGEIWVQEETGLGLVTTERRLARDKQGWVQNFQGCPRGILDLLNSRSCRSAIMFNDVLTLEQCQALVSRLSRCSFPFQCAHGRPSMAPLIDLVTFGKLYNRQPWEDGTAFGAKVKGFMSGR